MLKALLILCLVGIAVASIVEDRAKFAEWKQKQSRHYASAAEDKAKFEVFRTNRRIAEFHQARNPRAEFGMSKFMDMSLEEFKKTHLTLNGTQYKQWAHGLQQKTAAPVVASSSSVDPFEDVDWITNNNPANCSAVTEAKDEGDNCGASWAFAVSECIAACVMIKNHDNVDVIVSTQHIMDCCHAGGSYGCDGGSPPDCIEWATNTTTYMASCYPYEERSDACRVPKQPVVAAEPGTCEFVAMPPFDEIEIQRALHSAPVAVAVTGDILQTYDRGIIEGEDCWAMDPPNLAVLLTTMEGWYALEAPWGWDFGIDGWFMMDMDINCLNVAWSAAQAIPAKH